MEENEKVKQLIEKSLSRLITEDRHILQVNINERSLTHRLAVYLEQELKNFFPKLDGFSVDCEYNRDGELPKKLITTIAEIESNNTEAVTVYPDIIIHKRGSASDSNFLVIEAKKSNNTGSDAVFEDKRKLRAYQIDLNYKYAYFVILPVGNHADIPVSNLLMQNFRNIQELKRAHELAVAKDFAKFISKPTSSYSVIETPDPPDAILKANSGEQVWVEITDVFRNEEEAKEAYSWAFGGDVIYKHPPGVIFEPDKAISYSTVEGVERKLNKNSYKNALNKYGKGMLILWIDDPLFTPRTLDRIKKNFYNKSLSSDYFREVYIYCCIDMRRVFTKILE